MTGHIVHSSHHGASPRPELGNDLAMGSGPMLSVVVPVRDCEDDIVARIERTLQQVKQCVDDAFEIVVVDDGSQDETSRVVDSMRRDHANLRLAKHGRPRGLESAGQTGLERSVGDVVLIAENEKPLRIEDMKQLIQIAADPSVVAARAESTSPSPIAPLVRRLRANVADADQRIDLPREYSPVQMVRRGELQKAARDPQSVRLSCDSITATSLS